MTLTPTQYQRANDGSAPRPDIPRTAARWGGTLMVMAYWMIAAPGMAQSSSGAADDTEFARFRIIAERNIFNPNRAGARATRQEERPPVRVESFALVGTMSYEKGRFAFFDGASSEFRKVLSCGDSIAGFTVEEITPVDVGLVSSNLQLRLEVNAQLQREDGGEWKVVGRRETDVSTTGSKPSSAARDEDSRNAESETADHPEGVSPASSSEEVNEVLKRLMEKREKELK
jgi:hypothetical protein